jgi:long-chain acyl-CoA synthetase
VINRGGENVYCIEVENAVAAHPSVYESAVLSVPDEMLGERVGVVVVVKRDMTLEPIELRSYLADYLADFKIPEFIIIQKESLPRNPGGKVVKSLLRKETSWNSRRP